MPPKKNNSDEPKKSVEELIALLTDKVDALSTKQDERFNEMNDHFQELKKENSELKKRVLLLEEENTMLKSKLHDSELHSRSANIRVFNFIPQGEDCGFEELSSQLYDAVLLPILHGAVRKGRLTAVPSKDRLIVSAHPLPSKEGRPAPIFCRLLNGYYRTLILQCQKEFGRQYSRVGITGRPPPLQHPIYEDSTSELFKFKQKLAAQDSVAAAWISGGAVRFKFQNSETVRKVKNIFEPIENILSTT